MLSRSNPRRDWKKKGAFLARPEEQVLLQPRTMELTARLVL